MQVTKQQKNSLNGSIDEWILKAMKRRFEAGLSLETVEKVFSESSCKGIAARAMVWRRIADVFFEVSSSVSDRVELQGSQVP